jgi:hypothetical protein
MYPWVNVSRWNSLPTFILSFFCNNGVSFSHHHDSGLSLQSEWLNWHTEIIWRQPTNKKIHIYTYESLGGLNPKTLNPKKTLNPTTSMRANSLKQSSRRQQQSVFLWADIIHYYCLILKWVSMISCFLKEQNKVRRIYYYWLAS